MKVWSDDYVQNKYPRCNEVVQFPIVHYSEIYFVRLFCLEQSNVYFIKTKCKTYISQNTTLRSNFSQISTTWRAQNLFVLKLQNDTYLFNIAN